jgi:hypothetical protein
MQHATCFFPLPEACLKRRGLSKAARSNLDVVINLV